MVDLEEYLRLRERPDRRPAMYQRWRDLSFLHFGADPAVIRPLVPDCLDLDTFPDDSGREMAWIGLVPFWMKDIRLRGLPLVLGTHTFPETNVRTYVHRKGRAPGVWFFSLDAANRLACAWARRFFGLNYQWAEMSVSNEGPWRRYESKRMSSPSQTCRISIQVGQEMVRPEQGSLEFFLVERYLLYSLRGDKLYSGRVFHPPYSLQSAQLDDCSEQLTRAAGIEAKPWTNVVFSPGVDVSVFSLEPV